MFEKFETLENEEESLGTTETSMETIADDNDKSQSKSPSKTLEYFVI